MLWKMLTNITNNAYKIIMESLMKTRKEKENKRNCSKIYRTILHSKRIWWNVKNNGKTIHRFFFEYTDDENDVVWIDTIKRFTKTKLNSYNIGFSGNKFEDYLFQILQENNTIIHDQNIRKIRYRY